MSGKLMIVILILCSRSLVFASCEEKSIATFEVDNQDYYPYVFFVSYGQDITDDSSGSDEYQGYFYRVAVAVSEIYKSIIIEKITFGLEGSNMKIQSARQINDDDLAVNFDYSIHLIVDFEFLAWQSTTSFICRIHGDIFLVSEIDKPMIKMTRIR